MWTQCEHVFIEKVVYRDEVSAAVLGNLIDIDDLKPLVKRIILGNNVSPYIIVTRVFATYPRKICKQTLLMI